MFHKNSSGEIDDVKIIDFQTYYLQNPSQDLIFFILENLNIDQVADNLNSLLDLYYENFIETLKMIKFDVSSFTKKNSISKLKLTLVLNFYIVFIF